MGKFLKNFGLGLVYIALSPILLAILALAAVYGLGVCIYEFFAGAIRFFQGKEAFPPLWEDVRVAEIKKAQMDAQLQNPAPAPQAQPAGPSTVYVQQNYYQNHNGTAPQANPAPAPTNQPIDTTGYFHNPNPSTPTLDVSSTPAPAISSNPTPESLTQAQQIAQQPTTNPAGYIDISHDDDPKGGHE